jgi:hypothetical protein
MMTDKEGIYIKEHAIENMKVNGIMRRKKGFKFLFTFDDENGIHIRFWILVLEYVKLY